MRTVDAAGLRIGDGEPPRIMGVLNVSKESPYDPSVYDDPGEAAAYVDEQLIDQGADIVDIGLESANKKFEVLSPEQELDRLDTAVETIESTSGDAVFSLETRYARVAEEAIDRGFDMINDICGFADPEMPQVCSEYDVAVSKMASPPDLERPGAVSDVDWARDRSPEWAERADFVDKVYESLKNNGFTEKTIVDPAFGGWSERKTLEDDRETFRRLREFRALDRPILVSINRKNFLRSIADRSTDAALPVSLAATSMAVERGADVIRTHDVEATKDAALVGHELADTSPTTACELSARILDIRTVEEARRRIVAVGGDSDLAPEYVVRTVLIDGLNPERRRTLGDAASQAGVVCTGDRKALLGGTERTLRDCINILNERGARSLADTLETTL